jgi:hypothetical protein
LTAPSNRARTNAAAKTGGRHEEQNNPRNSRSHLTIQPSITKMPSTTKLAFYAYPNQPPSISQCIEEAVKRANQRRNNITFETWRENDIAGRPLLNPIIDKICNSALVVADISALNVNVTYEIGYAIGVSKRVLVTRNSAIKDQIELIQKVGIFDTLGYTVYPNDDVLAEILAQITDTHPIPVDYERSIKKPLYLLETPIPSQALRKTVSAIKRARYQYRTFSPSEESRLSANSAVEQVARSYGVIVPWLTSADSENSIHNLRAAFVCGIAHGMDRPTLALIEHGAEAPLDILDQIKRYKFPDDINTHIAEWIPLVAQEIQSTNPRSAPDRGFLSTLRLGDPMAENEFDTLGNYYIYTDNYARASRGDVSVVVGRKGCGKTALWTQLRDTLRQQNRTDNIVLDLKPEGYQLLKLRENVIDFLSEGAQAHLVTAFWEYLLLLELSYKLLEKDELRHLRNHDLTAPYQKLRALCQSDDDISEGDFSERLLSLSEKLAYNYKTKFQSQQNVRLVNAQVTELLHSHDIKILRSTIIEYLEHKQSVWVLFDNLDKGWSSQGISDEDYMMLRCLIDAGKKLQNDIRRARVPMCFIVFVRDDIYQILCEKSPDFGKDLKASLDWSDPDLLREMLRKRIIQNGLDPKLKFEDVWPRLIVSHINGEETSQYLIDRCLMRPRNLLKLLSHCIGAAVNFGHTRVEESDIEKGLANYSLDLIVEADQELADLMHGAEGFVYQLEREGREFALEDLHALMDLGKIPEDARSSVLEFLLYYGIFGIKVGDQEPEYIYHFGYNMKRLKVSIEKTGRSLKYIANPGLWNIVDPRQP